MARSLLEDLSFNTKWLTTFVVGKGALGQVEHVAVSQAPGLGLLQGIGAGTGSTLFGFVMMPLVVGLSSALAQMEHQHRRDSLRDEFRDEIAARLGKKPESVSDRDLEVAAHGSAREGVQGNDGLKHALTHSAKERNNMVMLSIISTFVAMAATKVLTEGLLEGLGAPAALGVRMAVGIATYFTVKRPLHWLASKIQGLEEPTVPDKAMGLARERERGITVSQEKLFDVYLDANPAIAERIEQEYGKKFPELSRRLRADALEQYGALVGLEEMTRDINAGIVKPTEIAFAAYGQESGVPRHAVAPPEHQPISTMDRVLHFCNDCLRSLTQLGKKPHVEKPHEYAVDMAHAAPLLDAASPQEKMEEEARSTISFVERVGRKAEPVPNASHAERLAMQKAESTPSLTLGA